MRHFTGPAERKQFYKLHQEGRTYEEIAEIYKISPMTVRMWCRRQRDGKGIEDRYYNPRAGVLSQFDPQILAKILELRQAHPGWGPESLLLHIRKLPELQGMLLPSRSSIGRYVHTFEEFRHTPKKRKE